MKVRAVATKEIYHNNDFYIIAFTPITPYPSELQLSDYLNFSCKGALSWCTIGQEYEMEIEFIEANNFGVTYQITDVPSLTSKDFSNLSREESFTILMSCTSSETIARNILDVYPDFINKILTEGQESIDTNKIKGVGKAYLSSYANTLLNKYKYFHLLMEYSDYNLNIEDCKKLYEKYSTEQDIYNAMNSVPYEVLCMLLDRPFSSVDKILKTTRKDLNKSNQRCCACIMDILDRNELDGSTWINGNEMYLVMKEEYCVPELLDMVVDVCEESEYIYYDKDTKRLSKTKTYVAECTIKDFVENKLNNSDVWDIDYEKYKVVDGFEMTDEQIGILKSVCENNINLLYGSAGCVDAETEFFNGKEWKSIAEYNETDKVLQYNTDGSANLVQPLRYIKEPCDTMYHFETKYGLNQTLSGDHRVIYKGVTHNKIHSYLSEITMEEMYNKHINENNFNGKFITTFNYDGKGIDLTDEEIRLMVATIADGTFYSKALEHQNSYYTCRFHIKKDRKKDRLRKLFKDANVKWREKESSANGYTDFYYTAPRREKEFTEYWYNCSNHQLQIICDEVFYWDGYVKTRDSGKITKSFSSNVKQNAEFIQFALSACGYRSVIKEYNRIGKQKTSLTNGKVYTNKTLEYQVSCTERRYCGLSTDYANRNKTPIEKVKPIDGYKYCFTVPSSMLILRRKGKIFITGNCGKTSCIKGLISMLEDNNKSYTLLSFSGKASLVLSNQTNRTATTIHLKCLRDGDIDSDVILIDEFTMTSIDTFLMLLNCVTNPNAKFVFVGDIAQLPAIALGKLFKDMLESGVVPSVSLTKIFRYTSDGALYAATNTRQGKPFLNDDIVSVKGNKYSIGNNFSFINTEYVGDEVLNQYSKLLDKGIKKQNILILTPMNKGEIGTIQLNNIIQAEFNPPRPNEVILKRNYGNKSIVFRQGDMVINCKNDYRAVSYDAYKQIQDSDGMLSEDDVADEILMNGQIGIVREVIDKQGLVIQFDEKLIFINRGKLNRLLLGYVISVHKSQGSTVDYTINVVSEQHKRMLNRNLEYVAITRSKEKTICVGDIGCFDDSLRYEANDYRRTWLKDLLTEDKKGGIIDGE